jgi:hypothetical protein
MIKKGFRWYVKTACGNYELEEYTYPTFDEVKRGMKDCLTDTTIPFSACGIDLVEDNDGSIKVLEYLVEPTETYYEF